MFYILAWSCLKRGQRISVLFSPMEKWSVRESRWTDGWLLPNILSPCYTVDNKTECLWPQMLCEADAKVEVSLVPMSATYSSWVSGLGNL